ncbi:YqiJ family protein [Thalassotalea sp. ND16A]|uniref:YqiJ family protein n=1 Tax=Thalassotalea sp. ND16A TaxID=1535422 RepID=UPI00051A69EF|nr:YqiJ family protein [Thalassotalea sp. ND16A]KGJ88041.1 hypothetical protein ND16A_2594 [Thalassotalea sp. ND16A]
MLEFFLSDLNITYTIALAIVFGLALLEGIALLIGASVMSMLDDLVDIDIDADVTPGGLTALLGWLCLNRLPMLVWLVLILISFAITGLVYNYCIVTTLNIAVLLWLSKPVALIGAMLLSHYLGDAIAKIVPKNESSAVSTDTFIGKVATITLGKATKGSAAEAVLKDEFNQKHYVMVEPDDEHSSFTQGASVVLMEKTANSWLAAKLK